MMVIRIVELVSDRTRRVTTSDQFYYCLATQNTYMTKEVLASPDGESASHSEGRFLHIRCLSCFRR